MSPHRLDAIGFGAIVNGQNLKGDIEFMEVAEVRHRGLKTSYRIDDNNGPRNAIFVDIVREPKECKCVVLVVARVWLDRGAVIANIDDRADLCSNRRSGQIIQIIAEAQ